MSAEAAERRQERPAPDGHRAGFVALAGRANVGKSTLLNTLVGAKLAIVGPQPQTTRQRILGVLTLPQGQAAFVDGPGFHRPLHQLGQLMLETAQQVLAQADVVLFVIDAAVGIGAGDRFALDQIQADGGSRPIVAALNKVDLVNKGRLLPLIDQVVNQWGCCEAVPVSALTGENADRLRAVIFERLPVGPPLFPADFLTDQDERAVVAELIREKLLVGLRQEVPHSVAVVIERLENAADGLTQIEASILVERDSQKGIVIGNKGGRLKEAGAAARTELEQRLGRKVFLSLWVKVRPDWRDRPAILRDLGVFPR